MAIFTLTEKQRAEFNNEFINFISGSALTQTELAVKLGVSQKTISNLCNKVYIPSTAFIRKFFRNSSRLFNIEDLRCNFSSFSLYETTVITSTRLKTEGEFFTEFCPFELAREELIKVIINRLNSDSSRLRAETLGKIYDIIQTEPS